MCLTVRGSRSEPWAAVSTRLHYPENAIVGRGIITGCRSVNGLQEPGQFTRLGSPFRSGDDLEARSEYERDYDRIVFSSAFRRMHGKTQVFPLPESDFTHTRLTHSIEVSCVGRSLGRMAGNRLKLSWATPGSFASILAAASLAHDIGNPPFGHSGEASISHFFHSDGQKYLDGLTQEETSDFLEFEGNALGFRLLARTKPTRSKLPGGLGLTYATLAAFSKYPRPSRPKSHSGGVSTKKFGFFQSERSIFAEVATEVRLQERADGAGWHRHPLAFLMEAADDICYRIIELEDGHHLGLVPFDAVRREFQDVIDAGPDPSLRRISDIISRDEQLGYMRAKAISSLIYQTVDVFSANWESILGAEFDDALLDHISAAPAISRIRTTTAEYIYSHRPVIEVEAAGYEVIGGLLADFVNSAMEHPRSRRSEKILSLISKDYLEQLGENESQYPVLMAIVEYVANMTDSFAIDTYRVLRGIELPNY